jgi:hypothetical protein
VWLVLQAGAKQAPEQQVDPAQIQDVIIWSSHTFMQDHLPLTNSPGAVQHQQQWEQQQQQLAAASKASSADAAHGLSPSGDGAVGSGDRDVVNGLSGVQGFERAESLMDHLAADENMIVADEQQGRASNGAADSKDMQPPRAHSLEHDAALEKVRLLQHLLHYPVS